MSLNPRIADWQGRVVWLVGASTGIGRATASLLHSRGAQVVVSARAADAISAFEASHAGSLGLALDVTDRVALQAALDTIVERFGRIDVVLHCAGTYQPMRAASFDLAVAVRHVEVNYVGALNLLDAVLPRLQTQRSGHFSVVSSVAGYRGLPNSLAYGPTKSALMNLAEALWFDLEPLGIGVSVICPGFVETPLTAGNDFRMPGLISPETAAKAIVEGWAAGRFEIRFPRRFTFWIKAVSHLGHGLYFRVVRRITGL